MKKSHIPFLLDPELARDKDKLFFLEVKGTSMTKARMHDGDLVLCRATNTFIDGAIMAVIYQGQSFIKRIKVRKKAVQLFWEDGSGTSLLTPFRNVEPQGEMIRILGAAASYGGEPESEEQPA
jgi:SOS-response transcriptional repressor LexA